jgi:pilus assembly protein CpaB
MAITRSQGITFVVAALAIGGMVSWFVYDTIQESRGRVVAQEPLEMVDVVVAAVSIPPGLTIRNEDLQSRSLPLIYIPDNVLKTPDEVVGRVAQERILQGELIREERLTNPEAGVGLAAIIPRGMRAKQLPVRNADALSGFLEPGNFVDIITVCADAEPPDARTLLEGVTVLAVNDRMLESTFEMDDGGKKKSRAKASITVALTPAQVELVQHALASCTLTLTLRNDIDVTQVDSNVVTETPTDDATFGPSPAGEPPTPG